MALVQFADVREWIGRDIPDALVPSVDRYIRSGVTKMTAYLGRTLESVARTDEVVVADPNPWADLYVPLPCTPVNAVTSVEVNGSLMPVGSWRMDRSGIIILTRPAVVSPTAPVGQVTVAVTYDGGYPADHPARAAAADAIVSRAGRLTMKAMDEAMGSDSAQVEGYSIRYDKEGFTDGEKAEVKRYRRPMVSAALTLPGAEGR